MEITELNTDTKVITTTNAAFKNCQAIWKMKFQDADGDINVTSVTIAADYIKNYTSGSLAFIGQITITPATPTNEIWVAVSSMNRDNNYVIKCVKMRHVRFQETELCQEREPSIREVLYFYADNGTHRCKLHHRNQHCI